MADSNTPETGGGTTRCGTLACYTRESEVFPGGIDDGLANYGLSLEAEQRLLIHELHLGANGRLEGIRVGDLTHQGRGTEALQHTGRTPECHDSSR